LAWLNLLTWLNTIEYGGYVTSYLRVSM
jgi:hypothetical protein